MTLTQTFVGTLFVEECYKCHVAFGMTVDHQQRCSERGDEFYCPNGHGQIYKTTELSRVRNERDRLKGRVTHLTDQRDAAHRSASAQKGVATKLRKRAAAGVCAFCQRSFKDVRRHVDSQHPEQSPGEV